MVSIVCNRKKIVCWFLFLIFLAGGWWLLRGGWRLKKNPFEIEINRKIQEPGKREQQLPPGGGKDFFVECRLTRDRICSERIELLKEISGNQASSAELRDQAQQGLMRLSENMGKETELEKLIMAQGFQDAVVMIQQQTATVILQPRSLPTTGVDRIKDMVARLTGMEPGNIFIISKP